MSCNSGDGCRVVPAEQALPANTESLRLSSPGEGLICCFLGAWRSLVARLVRDQEVPSSNLGAPTI